VGSLKGHFLIAVPELADLNFFRSVVLVLQHDQQGAMGVILNRPADVTVAQVWKEIFEVENGCHDRIHVGGPVEGPLILLHTQLARAELDVMPGIFVSMGKQHLQSIIDENVPPFRIYSGYAGWGAGQLEQEIEAGGWLTMPGEGDQIFASSEDLWKLVCETFGSQIMQGPLSGRVVVPPNSSLN
jgi:putative transcriptional regulator